MMSAEKHWDNIKNRIFKNGVPESIETLMQQGFKESLTEAEKWQRLIYCLEKLNKHLYKPKKQ